MEVVIVESPAEGARLVGDAIAELLVRQPNAVLGLATGSSPEPVYDNLVERYKAGTVSFRAARAFMLDEYVGLPTGHPGSYRMVIEEKVVDRLDFPSDAVRGPDGSSDDLIRACETYEREIADVGGVDLQLLGIGTDGHMGFNEPSSSLASRTRVKTLTAQTRADNSRFFGGDVRAVPRHVLTQGIGTILGARHLVLLAWGSSKARALARAVEGPVTSTVPASAIQLHPHVTVIADLPAAVDLTMTDYYRETWAAKPAWQGI